MPVQSGSDPVLARMNRGYTRAEYKAAVDLMRRHVPDLSLATDWIVGFPGETDADFEESCLAPPRDRLPEQLRLQVFAA